MKNSKQIAGLIGPTIVAVTISESVNVHIWSANIAAGVYLNGVLLFVAGLSIVRAHNLWVRGWPIIVTLAGWGMILLGLFRMFAPEMQLNGAKNTTGVVAASIFVLAIGIFLTFKAYAQDHKSASC